MSAAASAIVMPTTLRHEQALAWLNGLTLPSDPGCEAVIDASTLTSFDSSVLACLIEVRRRAQDQGTQVKITGLPNRLQRLAQVYGVTDLL